MSNELLTANSLAEAYLYLMATPCEVCGKGPLEGEDAKRIDASSNTLDEVALKVRIDIRCAACGADSHITFRLPHGTCVDEQTSLPCVNPTPDPSTIIDVAQWVTLFRVIATQASKTDDKMEARCLGLEAAQCLEEAIKFYEDDNDLPPPSALFYEATRQRLADHPEEFSRRRLLDLRSKWPSMSVIRAKTATAESTTKRKHWWKPW